MKKKSLKRSIRAHERLAEKHRQSYENSNDDARSWICAGYHSKCAKQQKELKRLLTVNEKEKIYKNTSWYYYN